LSKLLIEDFEGTDLAGERGGGDLTGGGTEERLTGELSKKLAGAEQGVVKCGKDKSRSSSESSEIQAPGMLPGRRHSSSEIIF
jgi:hypothetical protein